MDKFSDAELPAVTAGAEFAAPPPSGTESEAEQSPPEPGAAAELLALRKIITLRPVDIQSKMPGGWRLVELPEWLSQNGDWYFEHEETKARLYRHLDFCDDGTPLESWGVYMRRHGRADAICASLDLALQQYERFLKRDYLPKDNLLPWRI